MEDLADWVREFHDNPSCELEVRLGRIEGSRFVSGVSTREIFENLHSDMSDASSLIRQGTNEVLDYFYEWNGENIRSRTEFDIYNMQIAKTHIVKTVKRVVTFQHKDSNEGARISLSTERECIKLPKFCTPSKVRLKERVCFVDKRHDKHVWRYELSKTWTAPTRVAVETLKKISEPVFEVECELVDEDRQYLQCNSHETVSQSLLLKTVALMGLSSLSELVSLTASFQKMHKPSLSAHVCELNLLSEEEEETHSAKKKKDKP